MQEVDRLGWAVTVPLRAGDHVLGVRANTHELGQQLREVFADRLVPDADPPPNLSVYVAPEATDGPQELHRLYVTYTRTLRTRSQDRLLEAVWHELDMRDVRTAGVTPLVDAVLLVRSGVAHVFRAAARPRILDRERQLGDQGYRLVDRRWIDIDVTSGRLHLPSDGFEHISVRQQPEIAASRTTAVKMASWALDGADTTLAGRVVLAAGQLLDRHRHHGRESIEALSRLLQDLPDGDITIR